MREILFRGKQKASGVWLHGDLRQWSEKRKGICDYALGRTLDVYTETVGQFTGLTDRSGKKIFEGDIVNAVIVRDLGGGKETRKETGIIGYDKIGMIGLIAKYAGTIPVWSDFFQELTLSGCINDFWFEVIGNIHDNPELLEVEHEHR